MAELSTQRLAALGALLVLMGAFGFYTFPGMIDPDASGRKWVNAFYCSVITLTTVGFGDICPSDQLTHVGRTFIILLSVCGVGMFCGPVMNFASSWKDQVPGGLLGVTSLTLALGVIIFSRIGDLSELEAVYASIITGTTIGYGDKTPKTDLGKVAVALYAIFAINVVAAFLDPAKTFLESLCQVPTKKDESKVPTKKKETKEE